MKKAISLFMLLLLFTSNASAKYVRIKLYDKVLCSLINDTAILNHLILLTQNEKLITNWDKKVDVDSSLYALNVWPFEKYFQQHYSKRRLNKELYNISCSSSRINVHHFSCGIDFNAPFKISFCKRKYNLIEVNINYLGNKRESLEFSNTIVILYKYRNNRITKVEWHYLQS